MPTFRYKGARPDGEVVRGSLEAASVSDVVSHLQGEQVIPIQIDEEQGAAPVRGVSRFARTQVARAEVESFTRELATLLRAGLPLDRALGKQLAMYGRDAPMGKLLVEVRDEVRRGSQLSAALEKFPRLFDGVYINLVRAGESGGALPDVLNRLADYQSHSREIRDSLVSALIYPVILVLVAVVAVAVLMSYVVPQFAQLFADAQQTLPLPTRITLSISEALRDWGWLFVLGCALAGYLFRLRLRNERFRLKVDRQLLRLPLLGELLMRVQIARFSHTLAILLENGVNLMQGLRMVAHVFTNRVFVRAIEEAMADLKKGETIAAALEARRCFPPLFLQLVGVGEESGNLAPLLIQVGEAYDSQTRTLLKRLLAIVEPALILVLGVVVAGIVLSVLVAVLAVNDFAI